MNHVPDNFDTLCNAISEDQWQLNRKKIRQQKYIFIACCAVPALFIVGSVLAAAYMALTYVPLH